jgi:hypothetical protein
VQLVSKWQLHDTLKGSPVQSCPIFQDPSVGAYVKLVVASDVNASSMVLFTVAASITGRSKKRIIKNIEKKEEGVDSD